MGGVETEGWVPARLIPAGKLRPAEQETRATSVLLAVMKVVPAFARALLADVNAPKGTVSTFTEVRLKDGSGKTHIPDGAIIVARGKRSWSCLIEVKTGRDKLAQDQVERYLGMAREHKFDAVLTISNQIRSDAESLPYPVDKRKVGKLTVRHISWWRVLTEAIVQHRFRGVSDPEQAWILEELIRYLDDPRSGTSGFEGMGHEWVRVRDAAKNGSLRAADDGAQVIAARWEQLIEYVCLHLSQELGVDVKQQRPRGKSGQERVEAATKGLAESGQLERSIKVPGAVGPIAVTADLRSRQVTTAVELDAPSDLKRPKAKINWMIRQLREAPDDLRLDIRFAGGRRSTSEMLGHCRDNPECLLSPDDPKRDPRAFVLALSSKMGKTGDLRPGSFAVETRQQVTTFYRELVQDLQPPRPKAPQLPEKSDGAVPDHQPQVQTEAQARREQATGIRDLAELDGYFA